ncbi:hypothetical protein ACA910_005815 [Epithemia clementina (nom. ined.)]
MKKAFGQSSLSFIAHVLLSGFFSLDVWGLAPPLGSAARPLDKKKVVVLGAGGSMGSLAFGFAQRACSLYGTGLGDYRALGACADTSARLNSSLSKHFCLAFANEANVKLTDFTSVQAIQSRLSGYDALILGSDMAVQSRKLTFGTYERSPNDKCNEIYWKGPPTLIPQDGDRAIVEGILTNVLEAAKAAQMKHIVFVDESRDGFSYSGLLENTGVPFTRILPAGELVPLASYTYKDGVQGDLVLNQEKQTFAYDGRCYEEDIAALCIQCLLTLDWSRSRSFTVSTAGPITKDAIAQLKNTKRPDQQWCVNSLLLERALASSVFST